MLSETGYLVCRRGKVSLKENEATGGAHNVDVSTHCSKGKAIALVHTHNVNPNPSELDLQTSKDKGLSVCVVYKGIVKCYRRK